MWNLKRILLCVVFMKSYVCLSEIPKDQVDKVIEDEITGKLAEDLLQSIERKFQIDLQRSVDMVLMKIKMLLQNGTTHIQDRLVELQGMMEEIKSHGEKELESCLIERQNETSALAEKALHQMVVCGYALIGHDPAQAVRSVMSLKNMIRQPIHSQKTEVYSLLKVCGHDHQTLKKVIKCVISKSPSIKTSMMDVTGKLIEGIVDLTKRMAHGAMHEACLIEVIKTIEDEAFKLVRNIKNCAYNSTSEELNTFIEENNATVVDVKTGKDKEDEVREMKDLIRRMLEEKDQVGEGFKEKLLKFQKELAAVEENVIGGKGVKDDK